MQVRQLSQNRRPQSHIRTNFAILCYNTALARRWGWHSS
jgi:hypothetical protein